VCVTNRPKKAKKPYSGKLDICPDHSHRVQFGVVGGRQAVVLSFQFDQNQLSK